MANSSEKEILRVQSQINTPHDWILNGKMFRIKTWELGKEEVEEAVKPFIKGDYKLSQIMDKDRNLRGITLLYIESPDDIENVRTNILITPSGSELRKTSQFVKHISLTKTIKTTAPIWVTKEKILKIFSKYNTDLNKYNLIIDKKVTKDVTYPVVRFYPTTVDRNGIPTKVNVVYIEFSPKPECKYDSFVALSMEHRCLFKNNISGEEATLIFDKWTFEKNEIKKNKKLQI